MKGSQDTAKHTGPEGDGHADAGNQDGQAGIPLKGWRNDEDEMKDDREDKSSHNDRQTDPEPDK